MGVFEDSCRVKMLRMDISGEQLAQFSGVRQQALFPGLRGSKPLDGPSIEKIDRALRDLQTIAEIAKPFPLSFSDTRKVMFLLAKLREGDLSNVMSPRAKILADEMELTCA